jgi:hypothetical protein
MEEWMKQPVSHLKRLVKSRAGRVAELQMEIKILEGLIEKKVQDGDLGVSAPKSSRPERPSQEKPEKNKPEASNEEEPKRKELSKINEKSSDHAFEEMD